MVIGLSIRGQPVAITWYNDYYWKHSSYGVLCTRFSCNFEEPCMALAVIEKFNVPIESREIVYAY